MFKGILGKLMASYLLIILIALTLVSVFLSHLLEEFFVRAKERELIKKGGVILSLSQEYLTGALDQDATDYVLSVADKLLDARVHVIDKKGLVVISSEKGLARRKMAYDTTEALKGYPMVRRLTGDGRRKHVTMVLVTFPIFYDGELQGALMMNAPVLGLRATLNGIHRLIFYAALVTIGLASIVGYFFSRGISRPLCQMNQVALKMAQGDFKGRIQASSNDEVGELARTFNYLTTCLEGTIEALHQEKERMASMVRSITEAVVWINRDSIIALANLPAQYLFRQWDMERKSMEKVLPHKGLLQLFHRALQKGEGSVENLQLRPNRHVLARISPIHGSTGNVIGAVGLFSDVTDLYKAELMRRDFIANVSHELKTPLTGIRGFVEPLLDGTVDDEVTQRKYLSHIRDEALRLNRLIDELLRYSIIESDFIKLELTPLDMEQVIRSVGFRMQLLADVKRIQLVFNVPEALPPILGAEDKLEEVLINLLSNAIRYSPEGNRIIISAQEEGDMLRIGVRDFGPGIATEDMQYIWERFYKADKSRTPSESGLGLGLAIVKAIVEAHGGHVSLESGPGEGAFFSFTLPRASDDIS